MDKYDSVEDFRNGDSNSIDFEQDDQIRSTPIRDTSQVYTKPIYLGGSPGDNWIMPGAEGLGDEESYPHAAQIGGWMDKYLPLNDFEDKTPDQLDFGRDYTEDAEYPSELNFEDLEDIFNQYLTPAEPPIFGLPDGMSPPEDLDPNATVNEPNPNFSIQDNGRQMYQDHWNI